MSKTTNFFDPVQTKTIINNSLTVVHYNIQGIEDKFDELDQLLTEVNADIICVCEHWLVKTNMCFIKLNNFELVSYFCREQFKRGGVCILAKPQLDCKPVAYNSVEKHFEVCICEFNTVCNVYKVYIICVYRSPDSDFNVFINEFEEMMLSIFRANCYYVICGDINVNILCDSKQKNDLLNTMTEFDLKTHINVPTRITCNSSTCIDNIFSNLNLKSAKVNDIYLSDHTYQVCEFDLFVPDSSKNKYIDIRDFSNENINAFYSFLNNELWTNLYDDGNFNEKFDYFYDTFLYYYNCAFPLYKKRIVGKTKSWFTDELKHMHKHLCDMNNLSKRLKNPEYTKRYKEFRMIYKQAIKKARHTANDERIQNASNIVKESWKIINYSKIKNNSINEIVENGRTYTDATDICEIFNNFFINLSTVNTPSDIVDAQLPHLSQNFFLHPVVPKEVMEAITKTTKKYTAGIDGINGKILSAVKEIIANPLAHLINISFLSGQYPDSLKKSKCIPIFKNKGMKKDIENYRAICLPSQIGKVFDLLYYNRLYNYLETNNILINNQNGFRRKRSTRTAIADALNFIYEGLNNKEQVAGLFFDLSRAFDTVDHRLLLKKMESIGIRGPPLLWVSSYLSERMQVVSLKSRMSSCKKVPLGVPQGSVLGPLLFNIFINDISIASNKNDINSRLIMYADDTNVLLRHNNVETIYTQASTVANKFHSWCVSNGLTINVNKTTFMKFTTKNIALDYNKYIQLNSITVPTYKNVRFLGLTLDPKLTWEPHINILINKLSSLCFLIRSLRDTVSHSVLRLMYFGLAQSVMTYGIMFWGVSAHFERVFIMQKKILRCMDNKKQTYSCKYLFKKYSLLTLPCLYIYTLIIFIEENKHAYTHINGMHRYQTRNYEHIYLPFSRLTVSQAFTYHGIKCHNKAIKIISRCKNIDNLKHTLHSFLLIKMYYSLEEFLNDSF